MKSMYVCLLLQTGIVFGNPYLKAPQSIALQDFEQVINQARTVDFTWSFSGMSFNCLYSDGKAGFALTSLTLPDDCKEQFSSVTQGDVSFFACTQGETSDKLKVPELYPQKKSDYNVAEPRSFKKLLRPKSITSEQLVQYIKQHSVIFYTGAGLSVASGIPAMAQLETVLYIERNNNELNVKNIISHAIEILENFKKFCEEAVNAQPSIGHNAIAMLAHKKNCAVFTENVDTLHQKSGIAPLMVSAALKNDGQYFKDIDAIVCVGLSHDDRGLLAFYKEHNPAGVIIAIDLKQPDYLGEEDLLFVGDLQEILPLLSKRVE